MGAQSLAHKAHRCSFSPDRRDPYLRLNSVSVFVRDQDRSLRFYLDQLGFSLASDSRLPSGHRWLTVTPPDGTATLALVAPDPGSDEYQLIGRTTQVVFLTEDVPAKFEAWRRNGVRFIRSPELLASGAVSATFEDIDGNVFTLLGLDELRQEVEEHKREHAERFETERRAAHDLELARKAQAKLFPQNLPPVKTLDYAAVCLPARHVGGDYYDFLDLGRDCLGLVTADISGKGTAAALLMANLQAHLHNLCTSYWNRPFTPFALEQPERFLRTVNRLFYENTAEDTYATLFFAEYDDSTQRLRYANCGHLAALLLRNDESLVRLDATSTVLGLFQDWSCGVGEHHLLPGDTLALYTDGVTESFNDGGEEFGEQRLIEALRRCRKLSSQCLVDSLAEEVKRFSPHEQHDDITLVVARCRPN